MFKMISGCFKTAKNNIFKMCKRTFYTNFQIDRTNLTTLINFLLIYVTLAIDHGWIEVSVVGDPWFICLLKIYVNKIWKLIFQDVTDKLDTEINNKHTNNDDINKAIIDNNLGFDEELIKAAAAELGIDPALWEQFKKIEGLDKPLENENPDDLIDHESVLKKRSLELLHLTQSPWQEQLSWKQALHNQLMGNYGKNAGNGLVLAPTENKDAALYRTTTGEERLWRSFKEKREPNVSNYNFFVNNLKNSNIFYFIK